VVQVGP